MSFIPRFRKEHYNILINFVLLYKTRILYENFGFLTNWYHYYFFFLGRIDTIAILLKALKMWILAKAVHFRRTIRLSAAKRKF